MPNGKYDFDRDEPVSIDLDPETTLRALLAVGDGDEDGDEDGAQTD